MTTKNVIFKIHIYIYILLHFVTLFFLIISYFPKKILKKNITLL